VADILGRKRIYGYEVLILAFGAIASALAPNYTFLLVCRIILGIGIGIDYPVSATIMSEYSSKATRGKMVGLVFSMQAAGLVVGPLLAAILLASGLSDNLVWRLLLGFGAIPGLAVYYLRRQIHETPRFAMAGGAHEEAAAAIADATGGGSGAVAKGESTARHQQSALDGYMKIFRNRRILIWLIGTAGAWALLDFCYYGNTFVMGGSDHRNHPALARKLQDYLRWRNANARHPGVPPAQRRERARLRSERQQRWGRPKPKAA
jgi:MFS transporter, PHS family, inorganic phosphate transporter